MVGILSEQKGLMTDDGQSRRKGKSFRPGQPREAVAATLAPGPVHARGCGNTGDDTRGGRGTGGESGERHARQERWFAPGRMEEWESQARIQAGAFHIWVSKDNHVTGLRVFVEPAASGTLDAG